MSDFTICPTAFGQREKNCTKNTLCSGHYMITFSSYAKVVPGEYTDIHLYHKGVKESRFVSAMHVGESGNNMMTRVTGQW